jgi:hypothetical protein
MARDVTCVSFDGENLKVKTDIGLISSDSYNKQLVNNKKANKRQ